MIYTFNLLTLKKVAKLLNYRHKISSPPVSVSEIKELLRADCSVNQQTGGERAALTPGARVGVMGLCWGLVTHTCGRVEGIFFLRD